MSSGVYQASVNGHPCLEREKKVKKPAQTKVEIAHNDMKLTKIRWRREDKYKRGVFIGKEFLPKALPSMSDGSKIVAVELRAAGVGEFNGERLEFQDYRFYVGEE